jgi:glutamate/aspartate transport system permease protein
MLSLDFSGLSKALPLLAHGLATSLGFTAIGAGGGILIGCLLAVARSSGSGPLSWCARVYVDALRSVPLVMFLLWIFLALPLLTGATVGASGSAAISFVAFEAAYFCEIVRAGIQGVPKGQLDAARALGLSKAELQRLVVLPQAIRAMAPALLTQAIALFQDTTLVYAIGGEGLLKAAETAGHNFNRPAEFYLFAAAAYFFISFAASKAVARMTAHHRRPS